MEFGGRIFVDSALTFGCGSSPSIFTSVISPVVDLSCHIVVVDEDNILRQLDDGMGIGEKDDLDKWTTSYSWLCNELGIKLAPNSDDKAFLASREGVLLGIRYNLDSWTWSIKGNKVKKILIMLHMIVDGDPINGGFMEKIVGKLNHYFPIFHAKHERGFFLATLNSVPIINRGLRGPAKNKKFRVHPCAALISQAGNLLSFPSDYLINIYRLVD